MLLHSSPKSATERRIAFMRRTPVSESINQLRTMSLRFAARYSLCARSSRRSRRAPSMDEKESAGTPLLMRERQPQRMLLPLVTGGFCVCSSAVPSSPSASAAFDSVPDLPASMVPSSDFPSSSAFSSSSPRDFSSSSSRGRDLAIARVTASHFCIGRTDSALTSSRTASISLENHVSMSSLSALPTISSQNERNTAVLSTL